MPEEQRVFDYLIIGGGSAGGVLASRLSEAAEKSVLLVEAGRSLDATSISDHVASPYPGRAYFDRSLTWRNLKARFSDHEDAVDVPYEQGRGLGGTSLINGIGSNRGSPADYREWQESGAEGWDWPDVLPYFRKLESEKEHAQDLEHHGADGPWPIRHIPAASFTGFTKAAREVLFHRQFSEGADQNGAWRDGVFPAAVNLDGAGKRASIATTYLRSEVRRRPNLTILCDTQAVSLKVKNRVVVGARLLGKQGTVEVSALEVILCAGALHTPALLMRSGIGPAEPLAQLGIALVTDSPGVGQNLMEHPSIGVSALISRKARMPRQEQYHIQNILRWSSKLPDTPHGDMHTAIVARAGWHAVGRQMASLFSWVNKSYSTGEVALASADPLVEPVVRFHMLSDPRDMTRLAMAFRQSASVLLELMEAGIVKAAFPSTYSTRIKKLLAPTQRNRIMMHLAAPMIDHFGPVRRAVVRAARGDAPAISDLMRSDALLSDYLKTNVGGVWHPCGTARMGRAEDGLAVTAPDGRVHGVSGLRVCDASLMPTIPCANINVPVIMIAEKIADTIKASAMERNAA
jgi:5-(hydroxymethyl)furfural/furfural oxidase